MGFIGTILYPIEWVVAWIMYLAHEGLTLIGFPDGAGPAWVLSIVVLVIVIRIALIPLFFKQIKASRGMQLLQPELKAIQAKYKNKKDPASREAMSRETMALYKKHETNPFSSCMPILLQSPIFFALFRVLHGLGPISTGAQDPIGPINQSVAGDIESSTVFGAKLSDVFLQTDDLQAKLVIACLILAMCATMFFTQRQLTMKNMPKAALEGPAAQTQKIMLYGMPFIFAFSGVNFPVGVLVYWTTTNLWSMGQQFYTIKRMPAPGSEAERLMKERKARKAAAKGIDPAETTTQTAVIERPKGQRQQPKRKDRQKPRPAGGAGATPAQSGGTSGPGALTEGGDESSASEGPVVGNGASTTSPTKPVGPAATGSGGPGKASSGAQAKGGPQPASGQARSKTQKKPSGSGQPKKTGGR
ncbi:membrane protein insertase YidC [Cellulomonas sp. PhB143]|uniref:membrane protein insertase YidC n=1 Tax=Cellulomonas sp. PhB143 TaxID=2485186 RepID=UPI000F487D18|nr:membrane protein insertase YidC [Cellulomonas sp. PhB143]ROS75543.1 YidC/Oxa1 family membrane protein insertase [Cellulomonas sp. PhB143]